MEKKVAKEISKWTFFYPIINFELILNFGQKMWVTGYSQQLRTH